MGFFDGFADELMKIAGGAKATIDPKTGKWVFKPVAMPKAISPAPVQKAKVQPVNKPAGGGALQAGKKALKGGYGGVGSQTSQRKSLRREGVFGM